MKSLKDKSQKHDAAYTMESTSTKPISMRPMIRKTKYSPKGHVAEGTQEIDVTTSTTLPTEVNVNVPKVSGKEVVLLWTRADTDLWSDDTAADEVAYCEGDIQFIEKVKDAYLCIRYGTEPLVFQLQFCYVRLAICNPTEAWRDLPLPLPAAHLITLNLQHFPTPQEFSRFIEKKTKEQIDKFAFDCDFEGQEYNSKYSEFRDALCAKWKSFSSIVHWILFILSILMFLTGMYVMFFVVDPQPIWKILFMKIRNFIYDCIRIFSAPFKGMH